MVGDETEYFRRGVREVKVDADAVVFCDSQDAAWAADATKAGRRVSSKYMDGVGLVLTGGTGSMSPSLTKMARDFISR